ncbi:hypothetical protein [Agromyces sp. Soil535]|uniref:hypothetical protein n=1 Tax=Agromyces sp. Soil535 TaxID=1736390 RepID=UPI0006F4F536|nr:hypothetical protein [Agromyces sp. Soil535]KRE30210.1 hypothetical protein ASG80_18430 [Agromyces sp. Soil535]
MLIVIVCGALVAIALALCAVWGGERLVEPEFPPATPSGAAATTSRLRRHLDGLRLFGWWASMFLVVGTISGLLVTGAGGRLAMRLLAITSPEATGRLTEAGANVGEMTVEGTIAYLVFGGLPFAFASTALYLLVAPWLPRGRLAGPVFGLAAFILAAPFIDPLRADNVDFDIVGPGWLSVLVFAALAVVQGAFLAAFAGRLSRSLPLMTRRTWPETLMPLLLAVVLFPLGAVLAVGALVTFALPRLLPWFLAVRASRWGVIIGRALLAVGVLTALPAFVASVVSIWGR